MLKFLFIGLGPCLRSKWTATCRVSAVQQAFEEVPWAANVSGCLKGT